MMRAYITATGIALGLLAIGGLYDPRRGLSIATSAILSWLPLQRRCGSAEQSALRPADSGVP